MNIIFNEDCRTGLSRIESGSIHTCVTSPPYFGLRDYGVAGQIGLEPTLEEFVQEMVEVFREVRRVLRDDGTLWLNLGDSYAGSRRGAGDLSTDNRGNTASRFRDDQLIPLSDFRVSGLKPKDLMGIPWRVAFALQADGWYLRQDIIWHKPNPMPESVTDRCTKAHEYIFLFSKKARYYYDSDAISEEAIYSGLTGQDESGFKDPKKFNGKHSDKQRGHGRRHAGFNERWDKMTKEQQCSGKRNKRSVWTVSTKPFKQTHFATFPPELIDPCVLAGSPEGGMVLDPFMGAGTTALVARKRQRNYIGFELNPDYIQIANDRLRDELGMFV